MNISRIKRIEWIDIARGIGIIFVVLGHTYRSNVFQTWIYSFHMPLFFIISGILYNPQQVVHIDWKKWLSKKVKNLILPYILFGFLTFSYWRVIEFHFRSYDMGPTWFLLSLFIVEVVAKLIADILNEEYKKWICFVLILIAFIFIGFYFPETKGIVGWGQRIFSGLIWYISGFFLKKVVELESKNNNVIRRIAEMLLAIFSITIGIKNGRVDMYLNRFHNVCLYLIAGMIGTLFICYISQDIQKNKILEFLGRYSIVILCTHEPLKRAVIQIVSFLTRIDSELLRNNFFGGIAIAIMVLLIEIIIVQILIAFKNKMAGTHIEWLIGFLK